MVAQAEKPKLRQRYVLDIATRTKIRNAYLYRNVTNEEIAKQTGAPIWVVQGFIYRSKLPAEKRERENRLIKAHDARADAKVTQICEAIADESEEIALNGLQRARESTEARHEDAAKEFQAWTGGVSNLVRASRAARGLESKQESPGGANVNVFLVRGETLERPMVNVTPDPIQLATT